MERNINIQFNASDTWIMQTIIHCTGDDNNISLKEMISVGDMINHAIFLPGELQSGLLKFIFKGFIEISNKHIKFTDKGMTEFNKVLKNRKSLFKERDEIQKILKAEAWKSHQIMPVYDRTELQSFYTENEFNETCKIYQNEAMGIVKNLTKNESQT